MINSPNTFAISAPAVFDGDQFLSEHCVIVEGDRIANLVPASDCPRSLPVTQFHNGTLAPGFIDLQVNGGGDVLFNNTPEPKALAKMLHAHRGKGSTSILPTLLSDTRDKQEAAVAAVRTARSIANSGILGLHLEGPHFLPDKRGAHSEKLLRPLLAEDIEWLCSLRDIPLMLTLAPECVSAEVLARLAASGLILCAGHSDASYEQLATAAASGLQGVTHLYNAMRQLHARAPGMVGGALTLDELFAGIIADGHHVHPAALRLAHKAKPPGKLILVSDAMSTVGGNHGICELYGETIREQAGRLVNAQGALAGSAIGLIEAVHYAHSKAGLPLEEALRMASLYPAGIMHLDHSLGRLREGYRADLVHFNDSFVVSNTWLAGNGLVQPLAP